MLHCVSVYIYLCRWGCFRQLYDRLMSRLGYTRKSRVLLNADMSSLWEVWFEVQHERSISQNW